MDIIRKYDHIFFDLDNTLWDFDVNARITMEQTVAELKLDQQIDDFEEFYAYYEKINSALWEAYRKQEIRKPELIKKRFEDTLLRFNIKGVDPVTMNELYLDIMPLQTTLLPGVIETLDYLKSRHYHLHIISNGFKKVQTQKIKSSGLSAYFEKLFVSEEVNAPKPDVRIFRHALMNCNASKKKSIMIGDSFETDIIGAMGFGIDQVHFLKDDVVDSSSINHQNLSDNKLNGRRIKSTIPTHIINDMTKLQSIL